MGFWRDLYKILGYVMEEDPLRRAKPNELYGPFVHIPDAIPDVEQRKGKPIGDGTPLEPERG